MFQILFLSATFAFLIRTMYDLKFPRALVIVAAAYYLIMPFHIMYSFTIWKDVVFGAFVTLFVVFFVRLLTTEKQSVFDYVGFVISSMAFCLFRSNGLFAFVLFAAVFYFVLKKERKLVICMAVCIVISLLVKHAVFPMLQVTAPDTVEKLSIPLQQVARVFVDNGTVEDADRKLVGNIIDIDEVVEAYDPGISDPIKNLIRDHGNQQFIADNKGALMGMYLRTFVHNPLEYMLAFIDQTKGYWNSGYGQMLWYWDVEDNKFGLVRSIGQERINTAADEYLWLFYNDPILQIFVSIGLNIWILLLAFYRNAVSHNKLAFMTTIPGVAIIISLLVSTPVFSEFRYVYPIFCLLPFIILMTLSEPCGENADKGHSA